MSVERLHNSPTVVLLRACRERTPGVVFTAGLVGSTPGTGKQIWTSADNAATKK